MHQSPSPLVPMTTEPHYIINYNYKNIFMIADLANIKAHRYSLIVQSAIIMTALLDSVYNKFQRFQYIVNIIRSTKKTCTR